MNSHDTCEKNARNKGFIRENKCRCDLLSARDHIRSATHFSFGDTTSKTIVYAFSLASQPHFEAHGVSAFWIGATLSLGALLNIFATRSVHLLEERLRLSTILLFLNSTLGLMYLGLAFLLHPAFLVGLYVVMNGIFNIQVPVISNYVNTRTKSHVRATVLSGISFVRRFFQIGITWLLGIAVGAWGIQSGLILQGIYLILGAALSYYLLVRCGCTHKIFETTLEPIEFTS